MTTKHPIQPIVTDDEGILRFKKNHIVRDLLDFTSNRGFDLNEIARRNYSREDRQQLAQLIGYSLSGYGSLRNYVDDDAYVAAQLKVSGLDGAQAEQYPPCDFCGVIPDHHPWHGSGMFKGADSPHIHACNGCRHLLPAPDVSALVEALVWYSEQVLGCRKVTSEGEQYRAALDSDGGARARAALAARRKRGF